MAVGPAKPQPASLIDVSRRRDPLMLSRHTGSIAEGPAA